MQPKATDSIAQIDREVGGRINQRRRAIGLSDHDLALRLGLPTDRVAAFERGEEGLSAALLLLVARALETSAGALLGEIGQAETFLLGLSQPDAVALLQAYAALTAPEVRAALLALVQEMAEDSDFRAI